LRGEFLSAGISAESPNRKEGGIFDNVEKSDTTDEENAVRCEIDHPCSENGLARYLVVGLIPRAEIIMR
jgi:hypothetical protein